MSSQPETSMQPDAAQDRKQEKQALWACCGILAVCILFLGALGGGAAWYLMQDPVKDNMDILASAEAPLPAREEALDFLAEQSDPRVRPLLRDTLSDKNDSLRRKALLTLIQKGDRDAFDAIAPLLSDPSAETRILASKYLLKANKKKALSLLADIAFMENPDLSSFAIDQLRQERQASAQYLRDDIRNSTGERRVADLWLLAQVGGAASIETFMGLLSKKDPVLQAEVVRALRESELDLFHFWSLCLEKKRSSHLQELALTELVKQGKGAIPVLLTYFKEASGRQQKTITKILGNSADERAAKALAEAMQSNRGYLKDYKEALVNLGSLSVPYLLECAEKQEGYPRRYALEALGEIGDERAVAPLLNGMKIWRRYQDAAATALAQIGSAAVPGLIECMTHKDKYIRRRAVKALGEIGDDRASPALTKALQDTDSTVRRRAQQAAARIGNPDTIRTLITDFTSGERIRSGRAATSLRSMGKKALPQLLPLLKHADANIRRSAIGLIAWTKAPEAVMPLAGMVNDPDYKVAKEALEKLRPFKDKRAVPALVSTLSNKNTTLVARALDALREIPDPRALQPVLALAKNASTSVDLKTRAFSVLGTLGDPAAVEAIGPHVESKNSTLARAAIDALDDIHHERSIPYLKKGLGLHPYGDEVVDALRKVGWTPTAKEEQYYAWVRDKNVGKLKAEWSGFFALMKTRLQSDNWKVRNYAAAALVKIDADASRDLLLSTLEKQTTSAMAQILLNSGDPEMRKAAGKWAKDHGYYIQTYFR